MPTNTIHKALTPEDIDSALQAELTRLESLSLDDEEIDIARRYYSQKERKSMSAGSFCGPHRSFPITNQADVNNAARLIGHADNPDAVKACIKRKANANGWSLPDSWKDGDSRNMDIEIERAKAAAVHPPFTGSHSHGHPHEIDGYGHEHSHEHADDNMHDHAHTHHRSQAADAAFMYVPITRIDKDEWLVEGQATSDIVDHYNTFFDYDSSKRAFAAWRGNIREMHDEKKAVGRAIEIIPDDENHAIAVRARISRGARDTWEKVLDGTLNGFSIGVPKGKYKVKDVERNGKTVPMYYDHELAEVSLVDNPGSPGCNIAVVRADGVATEVLDDSEEPPAQDVTRAGARISHASQDQLHGVRNGLLRQLVAVLDLCACEEECAGLCALLDPDDDGDIDVIDSLDYDNDHGLPDGTSQNMNGGMAYNIEATITRQMSPLVTRMHAMLSQQAARPQIQPPTLSTEPIERRIEAVETRMKSDMAEVRSLLSEVKVLAEKIAAQPMPGGPVMTPVDKRLATQGQPQFNPNDDIAAIQRAAALGLLKDQDSQVAAAAQLFKLQNPGR